MQSNITGKNYDTTNRVVQLKIDELFAENVIPADDSVRLLDQIVEEMDLTPLMRAYSELGRKPATAPSTMLRVLLYANMENIYSSRAIESACKRDINFIWLLNGAPAPNYHEIARFRSRRVSECAEELFFELVKALKEAGEIKFEHLFVDGTKIEANANKYSFVWKKSTTKYEGGPQQSETGCCRNGTICQVRDNLWGRGDNALLLNDSVIRLPMFIRKRTA